LYYHVIYTGNQWLYKSSEPLVRSKSAIKALRSSTQTQKIKIFTFFSAKLTSFCLILPSRQVITGCQVV